jgi:hypothetical protein
MNRLFFGLSIIAFFSLVACVQVKTISSCRNCDAPPPPQGPLCQLNPPIMTVEKQKNSSWCWAASTTLVINHLNQLEPEPRDPLKQCSVVHTTLELDEHVDCCLVTDEEMWKYDPNNPDHIEAPQKVKDSVAVCHTALHPERALAAHGYGNRFKDVRWDPANTTPQGLTWEELTGQICNNRPFISVKLWSGVDEGGTHTEVITGNHYAPDAWVDLDTHGMDGFYTIPYNHYLGKPGDYVHVRDYYDIGL